MGITVTIKDSDILGYITVEELSKQTGVTKGAIYQMVHRGHLQALKIGHGRNKLLYFPKDTLVPVRHQGRSRKED